MAHKKIPGGGQFLLADVSSEQVFTPEDFSVEHRLVGGAKWQIQQIRVMLSLSGCN